MSNALETLKNRMGDCNEHAVLFAAFARAAGVPSQIEVGLVHLRGRFYYHAWNSVFLGKWITVDALMNQIPADVTHISLGQGQKAPDPRISSYPQRHRKHRHFHPGAAMIRLVHLSKTYGNTFAVCDVNLQVQPGEVFGFIGPNGAGKTTTIKMMAGLLSPTHGSVFIGGVVLQEAGPYIGCSWLA